MRGGIDKFWEAKMELVNSVPLLLHFDWPVEVGTTRKLSKRCQQVVVVIKNNMQHCTRTCGVFQGLILILFLVNIMSFSEITEFATTLNMYVGGYRAAFTQVSKHGWEQSGFHRSVETCGWE